MQEFWIRFSKMLDNHISQCDTIYQASDNKPCTFVYNIGGKRYQVRTTKYGPVIENLDDKIFISLSAFLKQSQKSLESLTKQDVVFLISFPKSCDEGVINYGRFGFYMTTHENISYALSIEDVLLS